MARRSSASRSSRSADRGSSSGKGPRVRSDGKVDVFCPQCGAQYRVAQENLDAKITCRDCTRVFFAKTTAGKRVRTKDYTSTYVGMGIGAVVIVGSLFALSKMGGYDKLDRPTVKVPERTAADIEREVRQDAAKKWGQRVAAGQLYGIREMTDLDAFGKALGVEPQGDRDTFEKAVLEAMKTNPDTRLLFELETSAAVVDEASATGPTGKATLWLTTKPGDTLYDRKTRGEMVIDFRMDGSTMKVHGYQVTMKPVQRGVRPGEESKFYKPSEHIAAPKENEIDSGGAKIKVRESEPVALPHEPGTTPELQQKIDSLVADLLRSGEPDAPGKLFGATSRALEEIGKPAVPRLLNAMHGLYSDVNANNQKISQVDRCLLAMTGMQFAYDVRGSGDAAKDKASRESVIRQWFAWWYRYANDTHTDAIDQEEDLLGPPKDKKTAGK